MKETQRLLNIKELFKDEEFIETETLRRRLKASESTIRRDLAELERLGVLKRVHGGAVVQVKEEEADYTWLRARGSAEKQRIGKAAAALVEEGQTVILDGGSTVAEVARHLMDRSLQVITNSIPIAEIFYNSKKVEVNLTGGYLYPRLGVLCGPLCEQMLAGITADVLIMGVGGISENGITNTNTLIVGSEQKMMEVSRRVILVAEHSKFGKDAMVPLAALQKANLIVSDTGLGPEHLQMLTRNKVEYILA